MGIMKRRLEEQQGRDEWALRFLCEVGVLEECENHEGTFFEGSADIEDAYPAFNARVSSGQIVLKRGEKPRQMTDILKAEYDANSGVDGCPWCEKAFGDDEAA